MKAYISHSGNVDRRGIGRMPFVCIYLEPENETEKAVIRMAYSGKRSVSIWSDGNAEIRFSMPRGKNEV